MINGTDNVYCRHFICISLLTHPKVMHGPGLDLRRLIPSCPVPETSVCVGSVSRPGIKGSIFELLQ